MLSPRPRPSKAPLEPRNLHVSSELCNWDRGSHASAWALLRFPMLCSGLPDFSRRGIGTVLVPVPSVGSVEGSVAHVEGPAV